MGNTKGCIAAHSISNMFFILRKDYTAKERREILSGLCTIFDVEGIDKAKLLSGLANEEFSDFEDCLQMECAKSYGADYIVTRNVSDYSVSDINGSAVLHVEFYDDKQIKFYEGQPGALTLIEDKPNLYDFCPLQGIPKNGEKMGSAEKVLADIDAYDRTVSDNSNDIESFASAYIVYENIQANEDEIRKAQRSGAIKFTTGAAGGKVYYLTKDINDAFTEHHLERLEKNIYRFSKTPNLNDESFGNASGTALKFKLTALESKCGMFEAKVISAGAYMFKLLASSWRKKRISVEPLQCVMEFKRNFPLDILGESQAAQALINTGMPKEIAWDKSLSFIDDIDYVMQLVENEKDGIPPLSEPDEENSMTEETDGGE